MRDHLIKCIKDGNMTLFPGIDAKRKRYLHSSRNKSLVELYCTCRMPYDSKEGRNMVECDECKEWYHKKCERISVEVFRNKNMTWQCSSCRSSSDSQ